MKRADDSNVVRPADYIRIGQRRHLTVSTTRTRWHIIVVGASRVAGIVPERIAWGHVDCRHPVKKQDVGRALISLRVVCRLAWAGEHAKVPLISPCLAGDVGTPRRVRTAKLVGWRNKPD